MELKFSIEKFPAGKRDYLFGNSVYFGKFPVERARSKYIPTGIFPEFPGKWKRSWFREFWKPLLLCNGHSNRLILTIGKHLEIRRWLVFPRQHYAYSYWFNSPLSVIWEDTWCFFSYQWLSIVCLCHIVVTYCFLKKLTIEKNTPSTYRHSRPVDLVFSRGWVSIWPCTSIIISNYFRFFYRCFTGYLAGLFLVSN